MTIYIPIVDFNESTETNNLSPVISFEVKQLKNKIIEKQQLIDKLIQENTVLKQNIVEMKLKTNAKIVENETQIGYLNDVIKKLCQQSADLAAKNELLQVELTHLKNINKIT